MKAIVVVLFTICLLHTNLPGQWKLVNQGNDYSTLNFTNTKTGWAVQDGNLKKTEDEGRTWNLVKSNTKLLCNTFDFLTDSIGWAVCDDTIKKTNDGGKTWYIQKKLGTPIDSIYAVTENLVYAIGEQTIFKTSDGGSNWEEIIINIPGMKILSACFPDTNIGIVMIGNPSGLNFIRRTFNGGKTWNTISPEFDKSINLNFTNDSTGYFIGSFTSGEYYICKSSNFFNTWSDLYVSDFPIYSCHFFNKNCCICLLKDNNCIQIQKSIDGGHTWENIHSSLFPVDNPPEIIYADENAMYFKCYLGFGKTQQKILVQTVDQGNSWHTAFLHYNFTDVCFINRQKGFIIGGAEGGIHCGWQYGNGFMTNNGGKTWEIVFGAFAICPYSCSFANNSNGYIVGHYCENGNSMFQTTNGGTFWDGSSQRLAGNSQAMKIIFINDNTGYICDGETLYKTTNGGISWKPEISAPLYSEFFINENIGWVVGESGNILKLNNEGIWKSKTSATTLPLIKVFFIDSLTGWIAGGYEYWSGNGFHPIVLKSFDGGETWNQIENVNYFISDFYFSNSLEGFAAAKDSNAISKIIGTHDGGLTWEVLNDSLPGQIRAMTCIDGIGWAVGDNGLILTSEKNYTPIKETKLSEDYNFHFKNYPNPFNRLTKINYQLEQNSYVELVVYDLMGKEIANLVHENQQPGQHEIEWNASGFMPGIYISKLKTRQNIQLIKMVLK